MDGFDESSQEESYICDGQHFFFLYKKELQGSQIFYMHIMYVQRPSVS